MRHSRHCEALPSVVSESSRARVIQGRWTWLALPFATARIECPDCTPSGWRRGFVANCTPKWKWCGAVTANSRCWSTAIPWLMAVPWPPWACSLQGGKCSMPFGPDSPGNRTSYPSSLIADPWIPDPESLILGSLIPSAEPRTQNAQRRVPNPIQSASPCSLSTATGSAWR